MSLLVECLYCRYPGKVPADAINCGLRCPQCAGLFMLVPRRSPAPRTMLAPSAAANAPAIWSAEDSPPRKTAVHKGKSKRSRKRRKTQFAPVAEKASPMAMMEPPSMAVIEAEERARQPIALEDPPPPIFLPEKPWTSTSYSDRAEDHERPPRCLLVGVGAMFLGIAALLCASMIGLPIVVLSLSVLGLLLGLGALYVAWASDHNCLLPGGGAALSGLVLLAALFAPGIFGPGYQVIQPVVQDPKAIHVALLPGQKDAADLRDPEWIDANRAGLRQGGVTVHVASAELASGDSPIFRNPDKDGKKKYLVLRLRIQRSASGRDFVSDEWREGGDKETNVRLTLTDNAGKVYPQLDIELKAGSSSQAQASGAFPVALANPGFVFEAPAIDVPALRVEVPVSAWGGIDAVRFTIPRTLIRSEAAPLNPMLNPPNFRRPDLKAK